MDDLQWLTLCVWTEARGEPDEGKAAVARVVLNRARRKPTPWFSDGTVKGTVLARGQFSDFWFEMIGGQYRRVCSTPVQAEARAAILFAEAITQHAIWARCQAAAQAVLAGTYTGPLYDRLGAEALQYANMAILHPPPAWATHDKHIVDIGHHSFFRA